MLQGHLLPLTGKYSQHVPLTLVVSNRAGRRKEMALELKVRRRLRLADLYPTLSTQLLSSVAAWVKCFRG